jgi:hypothetical protein
LEYALDQAQLRGKTTKDSVTDITVTVDFQPLRETLGPFAEHIWFSKRGPHFGFPETMLRSEIDAVRNQFAALRPSVEQLGFGNWHREEMERISWQMAEAPLVRYANPYGSSVTNADFEGITGWVDAEGVLQFVVHRTDRTPSGNVMFGRMMDSIGDQVRAITGWWARGLGPSDNLVSFNAAVRNSRLSPEDAARSSTFTGKMATRYGFTDVRIVAMDGHPGECRSVTVLFTRPNSTASPDTSSGNTASPSG